MSALVKLVVGFGALAGGLLVLPLEAQPMRPWCPQRTCVARAPFVCKGPVGSCGFMQGRCLRWVVRMGRCGGTFPQPH